MKSNQDTENMMRYYAYAHICMNVTETIIDGTITPKIMKNMIINNYRWNVIAQYGLCKTKINSKYHFKTLEKDIIVKISENEIDSNDTQNITLAKKIRITYIDNRKEISTKHLT